MTETLNANGILQGVVYVIQLMLFAYKVLHSVKNHRTV